MAPVPFNTFFFVNWKYLLQIHELGNPKARKPDDISSFYEVGLML